MSGTGRIVIGGGLLSDGESEPAPADLLLEDGLVAAVEPPGSFDRTGDVAERIDAAGRLVLPGLIDVHVHLREPGAEWKETIRTGSEAAVLGGFTTVCAMPNTDPRNDAAEITRFVLRRAAEAGLARVLPIGAVSKGLLGKEMAPLGELADAGCVAFSDDGEPIYDSGMMRRALEWCRMLGLTVSCHEEDKCLSCGGAMNESPLSFRLGLPGMPKVAEDVMVARDIELARATGGRAHVCHVSTARSVELVRRAKADGIPVTAEVTPHHLVLTEAAVAGEDGAAYDTYAKMSPPLREEEDVAALRRGLADGTIDAVASDHAPHDDDTKRVEFTRASFGILGLQTSLPLLLGLVEEGVLPRARAIASVTSAAAAAFGLDRSHGLGRLRKGYAADVTVADPGAERVLAAEDIRSKSRNSPFVGRTLRGAAEVVVVGGKVVVRDSALVRAGETR